jgi:hypothetical protein
MADDIITGEGHMADDNNHGGSFRPSRRKVLAAAAWTVPVVLVAQASPALAQVVETPSSPVYINFGSSNACKIPGSSWGRKCYDKGYVLWASFVNTTGVPVALTVTGMTVGGVPQCVVGTSVPSVTGCSTLVDPVTIPTTATATNPYIVGIFSNAATDSANTSVIVSIEYTPQGATTKTAVLGGDITTTVGPWSPGVGSCTFPPGCDLSKNDPPDLKGTDCALGC